MKIIIEIESESESELLETSHKVLRIECHTKKQIQTQAHFTTKHSKQIIKSQAGNTSVKVSHRWQVLVDSCCYQINKSSMEFRNSTFFFFLWIPKCQLRSYRDELHFCNFSSVSGKYHAIKLYCFRLRQNINHAPQPSLVPLLIQVSDNPFNWNTCMCQFH